MLIFHIWSFRTRAEVETRDDGNVVNKSHQIRQQIGLGWFCEIWGPFLTNYHCARIHADAAASSKNYDWFYQFLQGTQSWPISNWPAILRKHCVLGLLPSRVNALKHQWVLPIHIDLHLQGYVKVFSEERIHLPFWFENHQAGTIDRPVRSLAGSVRNKSLGTHFASIFLRNKAMP